MISWMSLLLRLMRFNAKGHEQVFLKPDLFFNWKGDITVNTPLRSITLQFTFIFFWLHLIGLHLRGYPTSHKACTM